MRIKCPECESVLSLGQPKPGNYRPKCKECGKAFRLKVTDDDPPKVGVGRLRSEPKGAASTEGAKPEKPVKSVASKTSSSKPASPQASASAASPNVNATLDNTSATEATMGAAPSADPDAGAGVEATMDSAAMDSAAGVEATIDSAPGLAPGAPANAGIEATMDAAAGMDATIGSVPNVDATMDAAGAVDATMDSAPGVEATMEASSAAATQSANLVEQTTANVGATIDGTVSSGSSVSPRSGASEKAIVKPGKSVVKSGKTVVSAGGSAAKSRAVAKRSPASGDDIPDKLGGYRILRLLGKGAMGAVYEAKQVSLDRLVALKTIRGRLANNPASLARFTREAYAAAQLTHHNVVQIYDFGEDAGRHFFSMEWVRGGPLDELIRDKGSLDPRLAAGYTLQAARGLQFAHRNGMVHRDIKPANLLLTDEGVVKVADLGLVKIPDVIDPESDVGATAISGGMESGTQVTMQGTAVGTPAYMAPEQGIDAAGVDHRADIYSLGCTLFYFLAGRPPFEGSLVSEVLEQHAKQPLPSLVEINARVPEALQQIVERSMAKRPDDRYLSLSEMIDDLEAYLGLSTDGDFSPTTEQADKWERIALHYTASAPMLRLVKPILLGLVSVSVLLTAVMPFLVGWSWFSLGPSLFVASIVTALVLNAGHSVIVARVRAWVGSLSWFDYGIGMLGAIVVLLVAFITGMAPGIIVGSLLGAAAGFVYHTVVIAPSRRKREPVLQDAERFVRDLRIGGADEDGVRSFAARYAGKPWQAIFEALFGYDSLCAMREQLRGDPSFPASTATSWRDKICANLLAKSKANREARDLKRLAKIEERGLQSEGVSASDARERAWQMASAVMDNAKPLATSSQEVDAQAAAEAKRQTMKAMLEDARSGKYKKQRDKLAPLRFALGGQTRLLAGCILLVIFAIWGNNNGLFESFKDLESLKSMKLDEVAAVASEAEVGTVLGSSPWSVGLAGLLLVMSAFVSGWRMTPFALVATVVILFGPVMGIPGLGERIAPWMVAALAGIAVYVPGIMFGESKEAQW